ncbi:MAG: PseG/SpsG family protein [Promethearchaeota archaeon]
MNRLKILIRADGYNKIGLGHIYRTIDLAYRLEKHEILFVSKNEHRLGINLIEKNNFNLKTFNDDHELWEVISEFNPIIVINDILDTRKEYIEKLKKRNIFVVNFEDLGEGSNLADLIINSLYDEKSKTGNYYWGKKYYILREEFHNVGIKVIKENVKNILITYGGTDPHNYSKKILNILNKLKLKNIRINVILGLGYKNPDKFKEFVKDFNLELTIKQNIKNISKYMYEADITFTSAGRTVYELASIGTPTIVLAQNEREMLHTFANETNGIINLGLGYKCSDQEIKDVLLRIINDFEFRKRCNKLMLKNNLKSGVNNVINLIFNKYEKFKEGV